MLGRAVGPAVALSLSLVASSAQAVDPGDGSINVTPGGRGVIDIGVLYPGQGGSSDLASSITPVSSGGGSGGSGSSCTWVPDYLNLGKYSTADPTLEKPDFTKGEAVTKGEYWAQACSDGTVRFTWVPNGQTPGAAAPVVTPAQLAEQAYSRLKLPKPVVVVNPPAGPGRFQLVHLPTWWWVENWQPVSRRTAAGGVWASVTATPVSSRFDGGDGGPEAACLGGGVAWRRGLPDSYSAACTYTYTRASASYSASVTVRWDIGWVGSGGTSGALPQMTTTTVQPLTVYERQALVTSGHG